MTKITFFRSGGVYYGFREEGHTGYADDGYDIVCAALSSMTMLIINTVEECYGGRVDYDIDDDTTTILVRSRSALPEFEEDERKRYAVSGLFLSYYRTLQDLMEEQYKYLTVSVTDREYDDLDEFPV